MLSIRTVDTSVHIASFVQYSTTIDAPHMSVAILSVSVDMILIGVVLCICIEAPWAVESPTTSYAMFCIPYLFVVAVWTIGTSQSVCYFSTVSALLVSVHPQSS